MKKYILFLAIIALFSSCTKTLDQKKVSPEPTSNDIESVQIPEGFDWKTTVDLDVSIMLPENQGVKRTMISSVDGTKMYFKGYPSDTTQRTLNTKITVPAYMEVLKVTNGVDEAFVDITGNILSFDFNNASFKSGTSIDCGECDGKITQLTLEYIGSVDNPTIFVEDKNGRVLYNGTIDGQNQFSFIGKDNKGTMSPRIYLFVNGGDETEIHTSCSVTILAGQVWGDYLIVSGESRNGGPLCEVEEEEPMSFAGTVIYEDLYPAKGDYDFNDLVVEYYYEINKDDDNYVTDIAATFTIKAFGASYHNAFGFQFPDVAPSDVASVDGGVFKANTIFDMAANGVEANQSKATFIVYDDAYDMMSHPGSGIGVNTTPGSDYVEPVSIEMTINFANNAVLFDDLDIGNFNPFIVMKQDRGYEVHLAGFEPTDLFDTNLYGVYDDASVPGSGIYFVTENNLPWAINIPDGFDYMKEKAVISSGYLKFVEWAQSGGVSYPDWYTDQPGYRNDSQLY